jgi:hypothetical protein
LTLEGLVPRERTATEAVTSPEAQGRENPLPRELLDDLIEDVYATRLPEEPPEGGILPEARAEDVREPARHET